MRNAALQYHELTEHASALDHWRLGRLYRYPICCIARWVIGSMLGDSEQGTKRGVHREDGNRCYVRCGIFHRRSLASRVHMTGCPEGTNNPSSLSK